jgi:hypothetical protein
MTPDLQSFVNQILQQVQSPFWHHVDFWIGAALSVAGLLFSILAFVEAKRAKQAAIAAGRTVKLQTIAIELSELTQKLGPIEPDILWKEARDTLAYISYRVHRATSPFTNDLKLSANISATLGALAAAQASLKAVRPTDPAKEKEAPLAVYNAIEDNFLTINNLVADLIGLIEKQGIESGDGDGES